MPEIECKQARQGTLSFVRVFPAFFPFLLPPPAPCLPKPNVRRRRHLQENAIAVRLTESPSRVNMNARSIRSRAKLDRVSFFNTDFLFPCKESGFKRVPSFNRTRSVCMEQVEVLQSRLLDRSKCRSCSENWLPSNVEIRVYRKVRVQEPASSYYACNGSLAGQLSLEREGTYNKDQKCISPMILTAHCLMQRLQFFRERYGSHLFKCGEDDDENNVYVKMKHFLYYMEHDGRWDDSPLYIFDSGFYKDRRRRAKGYKQTDQPNTLLGDYDVPEYFSDDLFRLTGERRRPPYRWLVIGGARSGTG